MFLDIYIIVRKINLFYFILIVPSSHLTSRWEKRVASLSSTPADTLINTQQ